ncbi:hypothetical protein [Serratia fonticola]
MMSDYINFMGLNFNKVAEKKRSFSGLDKEEGITPDDFEEDMFSSVVLWTTFSRHMTTYHFRHIINSVYLLTLICTY